ncbi:hypothetical protein EV144_1071 [Flavobacterium sp. 270]|nr:hypothetical protein EV144_1071 [Flavobacterium sp. 270]
MNLLKTTALALMGGKILLGRGSPPKDLEGQQDQAPYLS